MATVIKAGQAGEALLRLSTVDLADHLREARDVVERAEAHARGLLDDARREADEIRETARTQGYRDGYDAGCRAGDEEGRRKAFEEATARFNEEHASITAAFRAAIDAVERMKADLELAARDDVLRLAVAVATQLTLAVGRMYPEAAQENLRRAIRLVGTRTDLVVAVAEKDLASMQTFAESLMQTLGANVHVAVRADADVAPGGCRVMTDRTSVDATLKTQIDQAVQLLLGESAGGLDDAVRPEASSDA